MLPVVTRDDQGRWAVRVQAKADLAPLVDLARHRGAADVTGTANWDNWRYVQNGREAWELARATPRADAVVDQWINWDAVGDSPGSDRTPYLARRAFELGSVVWVAQDLGDRNLNRAPGR